MIFFYQMKNKRERERDMLHSQWFLQQILNSMLLHAVIDSKKKFQWWVQIITSNNLTPRICCVKYYESNIFQKKKKKQYTKKFTIFFTIIELANLPPSI